MGPKLARCVFYAAKYHQIVAQYHLETFLMHFMAKQHCLAEIWPKTAIFLHLSEQLEPPEYHEKHVILT